MDRIPAPSGQKINLTKNEDNSLNLHLVSTCINKHSDDFDFVEPHSAIVDSSCRYVELGNM